MPRAESILAWATTVANDWRDLAIAWHIALAVFVLAISIGWQPSRRLIASLLVLPLLSVALLALTTGNPFNGLMFGALTILLTRAARNLPDADARRVSAGWAVPGVALAILGSAYPHFLITQTRSEYVYAAPFGLLPCPTLLVVIGTTMVFRGMHSVRWTLPLVAAGFIYGLIGVFNLRVSLDIWLLAASTLLAVLIATGLVRERRIAGPRLVSDR